MTIIKLEMRNQCENESLKNKLRKVNYAVKAVTVKVLKETVQLVVRKIDAEQKLLENESNLRFNYLNEQIASLQNTLKPQPSHFPSGCMKPMNSAKSTKCDDVP